MKLARRVIFHLLQFWLHVGYRLYFRQVVLIDHRKVPNQRPVILAPNHQNSFFDAMMAAIFVPQRFTFLARADVFRHRWFRKIMYLVSCLPAYRTSDGFAKVRNNESTFQQCQNLLDDGESILIFPEGNQDFGYRLRPLKKGLARIALEFTNRTGQSVPVIPVGVHFENYRAFDGRLVVAYGDPLPSLNFLQTYKENPSLGLKRFTDELAAELNTIVISNDDPQQKGAINRYLFSMEYRAARDWKAAVAAVNSGTFLNDPVAFKTPKTEPAHWLGTPVAILALLVFILPYGFMRWLTRLISPDRFFEPSIEFVLFLTIFPWYIVLLSVGAGVYTQSITVGVLCSILAPLCGKYFLLWRRKLGFVNPDQKKSRSPMADGI